MSTPIVTRLHPSPELEAQGLGLPTTPQAVSRTLRDAGIVGMGVWRSKLQPQVVQVAHPPICHAEVLAALHARGYAAERARRDGIAVYGRRPA